MTTNSMDGALSRHRRLVADAGGLGALRRTCLAPNKVEDLRPHGLAALRRAHEFDQDIDRLGNLRLL